MKINHKKIFFNLLFNKKLWWAYYCIQTTVLMHILFVISKPTSYRLSQKNRFPLLSSKFWALLFNTLQWFSCLFQFSTTWPHWPNFSCSFCQYRNISVLFICQLDFLPLFSLIIKLLMMLSNQIKDKQINKQNHQQI